MAQLAISTDERAVTASTDSNQGDYRTHRSEMLAPSSRMFHKGSPMVVLLLCLLRLVKSM